MTPFHLRAEYWAYPIPEGKQDEWDIFEVDGKNYLNGIDDEGEMLAGTEPLPPGHWQIICTTKDCTEEQAKEIVPPVNNPFLKRNRYRDFTKPESHTVADAVCEWEESLQSLLKSKSLNGQNCIILKKS